MLYHDMIIKLFLLRRLSSAGRASALQAEGRGFEPLSLHHNFILLIDAGWSSPVARRAHNPKAAGSNPAPATNLEPWCSWPNMPACHAGDRGFESRRFRHLYLVLRLDSSVGRAEDWKSSCRRFESVSSHHKLYNRIRRCSSTGRATDL